MRRNRQNRFTLIGVVAVAAQLGYALSLRQRLRTMESLSDSLSTHEKPDECEGWVTLTTHPSIAGELLDLASQFAAAHQLEALDLVPGQVSRDRLCEILGQGTADLAGDDRLRLGKSAAECILLRTSVASDLELIDEFSLAPEELAKTAIRVQARCGKAYAAVVAPDLQSTHGNTRQRPEWVAVYGEATGSLMGWKAVGLSFLVGATLSRNRAIRSTAVLVNLAYAAMPYIATTNAAPIASKPRLTHLFRSINQLSAILRRFRELEWSPGQDPFEDSRLRLEAAGGIPASSEMFEPRLDTCPWCGGGQLQKMTEGPDYTQGKPGRYRHDTCLDCGHVFQNPPLSKRGLEFAYFDFYDGLGKQRMEFAFAGARTFYERRVRAILEYAPSPRNWLDFGCGMGHNAAVIREMVPAISITGADIGEGPLEALRRGWLDACVQAPIQELSPEFQEHFDVVTLHHVLEHLPNSRSALASAAALLKPGGTLEIEVPNPASKVGALIGAPWGHWFQTQHLHLLPHANLTKELRALGLEVDCVQFHEAHQACDLFLGVVNPMLYFGADQRFPWITKSDRRPRWMRPVVRALLGPISMIAIAIDALVATQTRSERSANTYRVIAHRPQVLPTTKRSI